ncbi:MAG: ACT domain-containing protein [Acidimicrobiales bacterium]
MSFDLVIEVDNQPGALAHVAAAVSDAGVNLAAATCLGKGDRTELHILVPHAEPVRHALALTHEASITREREVCVVEVHDDQPGVLADLARSVADKGINIDLLYVATHNRVVFGSQDLAGLKAALGQS